MRTVITATALAALALGTAPAAVADDSARDVITNLQNQGYNVVIDRVGSKSLDHCVVTAIRNPKTISRLPLGDERDDLNLSTVTLRRTITVSLNCS